MSHRHIIASLLSAIIFLADIVGSPVRDTYATYTQPDGSRFQVMVSGDEWIKIRKTMDGCAIVKDKDGWWCYGIYDDTGLIESSGYHVGNAPESVVSASRNIPYAILTKISRERRNIGQGSALETLESIRKSAAQTRSSENKVQKKGIALLVEFSDVKFTYRREDFIALLNQKGYNGTGSAKDYYEDQFGDGWEFSFDVSDIITLSWPAEHYGKNDNDGTDIRPWDMVAEACRIADDKIDFSLYDQDRDGNVDNVYIFYAGLSESEHSDQPDLIWPHQYYIYSGERINLNCDEKRIDRYACSAEITGERSLTGIGTFCHEFGHTLGLVDLYDTDSDQNGGWAAGAWKKTSLMDGGNYNNNSATPPNFNCIEREILGLSIPAPIEPGNTYTMDPIHRNGICFKLESGTDGEYYLFECRSDEGWDKYIGGSGMLAYHIDKLATDRIGSQTLSRWKANTVNADQAHQCADLIEADGRSDLITSHMDFNNSLKGIFFPQDNVTAITTNGTPGLTYWYGNAPDISITGIRKDGEDIIFNTVNSSSLSEIPSVADISFNTFPDAAIITFSKSDLSIAGAPSVKWRKSGSNDEYTPADVVEYANGKYACKIPGLESGNISYESLIRFESEGGIGDSYRLSFMTKRKPTVKWPYIYLSTSEIKVSDSIALHAVNSGDRVYWEFNGEELIPERGFFFHPERSGQLKATVTRDDGSCDIMIKEITLKEL